MNNPQLRLYQIGATVGILLTVFLAVLSIKEIKSIAYVGKDLPITNTITVTGTGDAVSIPDVATFSFSVTETAKAVADAQSAATAKTNAAIKAMKDAGVEDKDIKTLSYNINPHYEYDATGSLCATYGTANIPCHPGTSVLTGYDVSQSIQIKVRDLTKAGSLFATIGSLGVQNVNGLSFSIDDMDSVKADARNAAIENAKAKAQTLARQLGVSLVRITNFYESGDNQVYPYASDAMNSGMMVKTAAAPQVPTGEQKTTSNVSITYEIR